MLLEHVCDGDRLEARQKRAIDLRKNQGVMTCLEAAHSWRPLPLTFGFARVG
jgi:hypothetical protein